MPEIEYAYYAWSVMLLLAAAVAWSTNFISLPGNWFIVGLAALFVAALETGEAASGLNWQAVGLLALVAAGGEALEFFASAAGAAKKGGSRRAVVLAIIGTIAGSIAGAVMGVPIPVIGSLFGALVGGAAGAFAGAYLGEMWKHGMADQSVNVGFGAAVGRVLGTVGKVLVGTVMLVILAVRVYS